MNIRKLATMLGIIIICFTLATSAIADNLIKYVAQLKNKIPRARYVTPSNTQIRLLQIAATSILHKDFARASRDANSVSYSVKILTHTNGSKYYILYPNHPKHRAWGTYIFYLAADGYDYSIEIPHPLDSNAVMTGINAFIDSKAKAFLMSGIHSKKFDVTKEHNNVFNAIHEEISFCIIGTIQIQGFHINHYPQIFLTSGTSVTNNTMDLLDFTLMDQGFEVEVYNGVDYPEINAADNIQAIYCSGFDDYDFAGLFVNQNMLTSTKKSTLIVDAVEAAISETITY